MLRISDARYHLWYQRVISAQDALPGTQSEQPYCYFLNITESLLDLPSLVGCCQNCYTTPSFTCRMHPVPPARREEGSRSLKSLSCRVPPPDHPQTHRHRLVCMRARMRIYTEFLIIHGDRPRAHTHTHSRPSLLSSHGGAQQCCWFSESERCRKLVF